MIKLDLLVFLLLLAMLLMGCSSSKPLTFYDDRPDLTEENTDAVNKSKEGSTDFKDKNSESTKGEMDPKDKGTESEDMNPMDKGTINTDETLVKKKNDFYITPITDDIFKRIKGKSFKKDCTLPRDDLRYLHVLHKDLDGNVHEGEMIVNKHIAEDVLDILKELYKADYPIEKIRLIDEYDADDEASMEDNNSSSFNFRFVSHTNKVSKHGLGLAVDINTLYNPYIKYIDGKRVIEPITAEAYLDRDTDFHYKIDENDLCYKLFTKKGFVWGGSWENSKDYQHFEVPDKQINEWYPDFRR